MGDEARPYQVADQCRKVGSYCVHLLCSMQEQLKLGQIVSTIFDYLNLQPHLLPDAQLVKLQH